MAKYQTIAPNGQSVTVSHAYGSKRFTHGEIIENDKLAVLFPNLFIRLPDVDVAPAPVVVPEGTVEKVLSEIAALVTKDMDEIESEISEDDADALLDVASETVEKVMDEVVKKKAGRGRPKKVAKG